MLGERHRRRLARPAQVQKAAIGVARSIVAPARDVDRAEPAPAGSVRTQGDVVATVRQQLRGGHGHLLRPHATLHHLGILRHCVRVHTLRALQWISQARQLVRYALLQQRRHGGQARVGHAPAAWRALQQHIGQSDQGHALVVRHEGADEREAAVTVLAAVQNAGLPSDLAFWAVVQRLDEAAGAACLQAIEHPHVGQCRQRVEHRRQRAGVGRHHQLIGWRAAHGQAWHALRRVLVGERVVHRRVGAFREAPGHAALAAIGDLLAQR